MVPIKVERLVDFYMEMASIFFIIITQKLTFSIPFEVKIICGWY